MLKSAGKYDLDAIPKRYGRCIVDFKTGKDVYEEHKIQASAYLFASEHVLVPDIYDNAMIVNCNKATGILRDNDVVVVPREDCERYFEMFKCLLRFFYLTKEK